MEAVRSAGGAGHLHEQDLPLAVAVDVLDDGALALAGEGCAVGPFVQGIVELEPPDLVLLIIQGGEETSVNGKGDRLRGAEQPVMLDEVMGKGGQQEQWNGPPSGEAGLAALPPRNRTLAPGQPAAEFLWVRGDPAVGIGRTLDGQARLPLPHLHRAHAGIEEGGDLFPGVEPLTTLGGSRHGSRPCGECLQDLLSTRCTAVSRVAAGSA